MAKNDPLKTARLSWRKELRRENREWPRHLVRLPDAKILPEQRAAGMVAVWRSRDYLVQVYAERPGLTRLSIHRTDMNAAGEWVDGIRWEELQRLKAECGFGDRDAVEVYPRDEDLVNVANIRHIWVMDEPLDFAWRGQER